MLALVETTLVIIIMSNDNDISKASMWLGFSGLRESMTPVGGYESSWKHTKSQRFQLSSTRTSRISMRFYLLLLDAPSLKMFRPSRPRFQHAFREDMRHFSDVGSVSGQLIDSDHRGLWKRLWDLWCPPRRRRLWRMTNKDYVMVMRLDYAILQSEEGRDELLN